MNAFKNEIFLNDAMNKHGDEVYRLALCRLQNKTDAEDVYQEVFLKLFFTKTDFEDDEHLKAWLLRVTINKCCDLRRCAWFKNKTVLENEIVAEMPDEYIDLWQSISVLSKDLRTVIWLHYVEGYKTEEISQILKCNSSTVRTKLYRARKKLRKDLEVVQNETCY